MSATQFSQPFTINLRPDCDPFPSSTSIMKGSSLFSPRTWRKKRLQRTTSETVSSVHGGFNSKPSPDSIWVVRDTYYASHARSAINLRSSELSEDDDTPRASICLPKPSSKSAILVMDHSVSSQLPRRPPRPPSLNLEKPEPIPQSHTPPKTPAVGPSVTSVSSSSHPPCPSLNLEKSQPTAQSCPPKIPVVDSPVPEERAFSPNRYHSHLGTTPKTRLCLKRGVPELDGVWKGFLEELEEDLQTLSGNSTSTRSLPTSRPRSRSNTTPCPPRTKRFQDLPPSPHFDKRKFDIPKFAADHSSDVEPPEANSPTADLSVSLSLFPAPPPLRIRKKVSLRPLELRIEPFPSSPNGSSPDSTPVATPTTPTLLSSKSPSPRRSKPQDPSRPNHTSHVISAPERPILIRPSPSDSFIQTQLRHSQSFCHPSHKRLRALHRTTSSELVSSSCTSENQFKSFPISCSSPPYLQSRGRKPTRSVHASVQWGIAV